MREFSSGYLAPLAATSRTWGRACEGDSGRGGVCRPVHRADAAGVGVRGYDALLHAPGPRHHRELTCGECGYRWEVERDDDLECPECEGEAE